ncbi:MAG: hypothetical protein AMXMBFR82_50130 [Candidatus Hydrogenedentota bacterium]
MTQIRNEQPNTQTHDISLGDVTETSVHRSTDPDGKTRAVLLPEPCGTGALTCVFLPIPRHPRERAVLYVTIAI